jgi:FkbM family methyltransferase
VVKKEVGRMMADYEQLLETFYRSLLRPGDVVIDAGAHTGRHTLPMIRAVSPSGKVYAFEPLPFARFELERAAAATDPNSTVVMIYPYALSNREGTDDFVVAVDLPAYSGLKTRIYDGPCRTDKIQVQVRMLDHLFIEVERLEYIKIDAEGGELDILRGATAILDRLRPVVTFEFGANSIGNYGVTVEDMADFWLPKPYVLFDILGRPLSSDQFVQSAVKQEVWDYLAVPIERADRIIHSWRSAMNTV